MINLELEHPVNSEHPELPTKLPDKWDEDTPPKNEERKLFQEWQGKAVMIFGVALPSLFITLFASTCFDRVCMLMIKHPVETFIECALMLSIPLGNLSIWSTVCKKDTRFALRRGIINGIAGGSALLTCAICMTAVAMARAAIFHGPAETLFVQGFVLIAIIFLCSCLASIYLAFQLRELREFKSARLRTIIYSAVGLLLSVLALAGSEAKSMYMRVAEQMTLSGATPQEQQNGLQILRGMNPELDMRLECADPRTVGLCGLFIPLSNANEQQLYFTATGKPFRDDRSNDLSVFSNDYLHRHVVGASIPELSLVRSGMDGTVSPETLSSTISWTFVFKNISYEDKEARAEFELPPGAVITDVSVWQNGQAEKASFAASGKAPSSSNWQDVGHTTPAVVSDLGRGRTLLHCYPVKAQDELKVQMTFVMPLKLDGPKEASLSLPRFIDTNFQVKGDHQMRLRSSQQLSLKKIDGLKESKAATGEQVLSGKLKNDDLSGINLTVVAARKETYGPIAIADPVTPGRFVIQTIRKAPVKLPNHLIVVLDGSQSVKAELQSIKDGLSKMPENVISTLIVASDFHTDLQELRPLSGGLNKLAEKDLDGGQDNLQAVVKAASTAGENKDGAVLWIHGPQPTINKELYAIAPYTQTPTFYDFALDNSATDCNEFFKNHREIGPFNAVPRNGSIQHDLERFVSRWQPDGVEYVVHNDEAFVSPKCRTGSAQEAKELSSLTANEACQKLIGNGNYSAAAQTAVQHQLVTPVSSAIVMPGFNREQVRQMVAWNQNQGQAPAEQQRENSQTLAAAMPAPSSYVQAPSLQGATNGTIGPQGTDATFVTGVNTAGTVRVNNLANLEALLNLIANGCEILGIVFGLGLSSIAMTNLEAAQKFMGTKALGRKSLIALGVLAILAGMCVPGCINWLVASARDANLFS